MKRILTSIMALALLLLAVVGCGTSSSSSQAQSQEEEAAVGTVTVQVNPHFEVHYDERGNVCELHAKNEDAEKLLKDYRDYKGKPCKTVVGELVILIGNAGYFEPDKQGNAPQLHIEIPQGAQLPDDDTFFDGIEQEVRGKAEEHHWHVDHKFDNHGHHRHEAVESVQSSRESSSQSSASSSASQSSRPAASRPSVSQSSSSQSQSSRPSASSSQSASASAPEPELAYTVQDIYGDYEGYNTVKYTDNGIEYEQLDRNWYTIAEGGFSGGGMRYTLFDSKYSAGTYGTLTKDEAWQQERNANQTYVYNGKRYVYAAAGDWYSPATITTDCIIQENGVKLPFVFDPDTQSLIFTNTGERYRKVSGSITVADVYGTYQCYEYVEREDADIVQYTLSIHQDGTYDSDSAACLTFDHAYEKYWSDRSKEEVFQERQTAGLVFDYNGTYYTVGYGEVSGGTIKELTETYMITDKTTKFAYQIKWDGSQITVTAPGGYVYCKQS